MLCSALISRSQFDWRSDYPFGACFLIIPWSGLPQLLCKDHSHHLTFMHVVTTVVYCLAQNAAPKQFTAWAPNYHGLLPSHTADSPTFRLIPASLPQCAPHAISMYFPTNKVPEHGSSVVVPNISLLTEQICREGFSNSQDARSEISLSFLWLFYNPQSVAYPHPSVNAAP